jgi:nicotinamide mononucleotide transporter
MDFFAWLDLFKQQLSEADAAQWAVLILGVAEVLLAKANKIWLYPTGIAATLLSVYGLFQAQLYAESFLNVYYLVMSVYGWWYWVAKKNEPPVRITHASAADWKITVVIVAGAGVLLYFILKFYTPSNVPAWDAWVSATAWAGMWLLAKRKVENWILLNISNAFAIPLLFYKSLPLYGVLTIVLFVVACFGYFDWKKIESTQVIGSDNDNLRKS